MSISYEELEEQQKRLDKRFEKLSRSEKDFVNNLYESRQLKASKFSVYRRLFFLGGNHFYLGNWKRGAFNLCIFILAVAGMYDDNRNLLIPLGLVILLEVPEMFVGKKRLQARNQEIFTNCLAEVKMAKGSLTQKK